MDTTAPPTDKSKHAIVAVLIVVVLLILYTLATWTTEPNEKYMTGFWMADDDEFCETSDINSMLLYIGDPTSSFGSVTRDCYIVVTDDIYAGGFTMKYRKRWAGVSIGKYMVSAEVEFEDNVSDENGEPDLLWPHNVDVTIDMIAGTLLVTHGDMVYARLYKNHEITGAPGDI